MNHSRRNGTAVIQPTKFSVSNALDINNVGELLRTARNKSSEDDSKAIPAFEAGQALFKEKRYTEALRKYIQAALLGHLKAQRRLGVMYLEGIGCNKDYLSALKWLKIASERKDVHAQERLANMYRRGLGVDEDVETAIYWYHRSKELGSVQSTFELASCYERGEGTTQDCDEATRLFMLAAEQGHSGARYHVGLAYELGQGLDQNTQEAIDWYILAIQGGNEKANIRLWSLVDDGDFVPETAEEAKFAEHIGLSVNDPICKFKYAIRLMSGFCCDRDFEKSIDLLCSALEELEIFSSKQRLHLELLKVNNKVVSQETSFIVCFKEELLKQVKSKWLLSDFYNIKFKHINNMYSMLINAGLGKQKEQYRLAKCYLDGSIVEKNSKKSIFWLKKAAKQGNRDAYRMLGDIYKNKKKKKKYKSKSVRFYKKAVRLGCPIAMFNLAWCYRKGFGVFQCEEKFIYYISMYTNLNCSDAMYTLTREVFKRIIDRIFMICEGSSQDENIEMDEQFRDYWLNRSAHCGNLDAKIELNRKKEYFLRLNAYDFTLNENNNVLQPDIDEIEDFQSKVLEILHQRFTKNVDEGLLMEIVDEYFHCALAGSIDAIVRLIELQSRERISEVSILMAKKIEEKINLLLNRIKDNFVHLAEIDKGVKRKLVRKKKYLTDMSLDDDSCVDPIELEWKFEEAVSRSVYRWLVG